MAIHEYLKLLGYRSGRRWVGLELSSVVVGYSLFNFMLGVHDEWTIACDGFVQGLCCNQKKPRTGMACCNTDRITVTQCAKLSSTQPYWRILIIWQVELAIGY